MIIGGMFYVWLVILNPGDEISQSNIEKILAMESPVYYRNGKDKIGVFFEVAHRQYVPYENIPPHFVKSIVAAEDNKFFDHSGIDFIGVTRAMVANVRAGRIVQGGSTITQQTAKNLFKRKDRSIKAKLKELLYALRLEYHYPKEKILEFYANQFYVSGNGRGLGVAARYYFNKPVEDLTMLESAFIAGSVKRPNYYNPFTKDTEEGMLAARRRARYRVKYVLKQMFRSSMIDVATYNNSVAKPIPFNQGRMYYSLNTIMDMVKDAMNGPEIEEALSQHGIDNVSTSGIRIITTVERDIQEQSYFAVRKELSRLDVRLRGYEREEIVTEYARLPFGEETELRTGGFTTGRILSVDLNEKDPSVLVSFSDNEEAPVIGRIDWPGLKNLLVPLVRHERFAWSTARQKDLKLLEERLQEGDRVYVSIKGLSASGEEYLLDLEKYPELQGAAMVLKDGTIRAMVGGMENRYYNRAITARRPMGSVIKPLVYTAAMQLGWSNIDILNNRRNVFVYQKGPYFPRPDHTSPFAGVSMTWAGVLSENVATVWLLYHLCDYLSPAQFKELINQLGMDRYPGEPLIEYKRRIRDSYGIVVDENSLRQVAFDRAVAEMEPDLIFAGHLDEYETLRTFHYGSDFERFYQDIEYDLDLRAEPAAEGEEIEEVELSATERQKLEAEAEMRRNILSRNFIRLRKLLHSLEGLKQGVLHFTEFSRLGFETGLYRNVQNSKYIFTDKYLPAEEKGEEAPPENEKKGKREKVERIIPPVPSYLEPVAIAELAEMLLEMDDRERYEFWDNVLIDGELSAETVAMLKENVDEEYAKLIDISPYSPEVLHQIRDFRVLAALKYVTGFCREIGIESRLDPVLSFPLGSNVISLLEVVRSYEGLATGNVRVHAGNGGSEGLALIERIEDSDGEVIYVPNRKIKQVVAPEISLSMSDILRNVVKFGTGRYAYRNVRLGSHDPQKRRQLEELDLTVPVGGKTGTANNFTNASFAGIIPSLGSNQAFTMANGYIIASYVGFDDNTPMVHNTTHITGAGGALPICSITIMPPDWIWLT